MTEPLTPERAEALRTRAFYVGKIDRLRRDGDLTPEARNRRIAEMHAEGRGKLNEMHGTETARLQIQRKLAMRDLFNGLRLGWDAEPSDAVSIRDAMDRAASLRNPEEAAALLARAHANEDPALMSAIGQEAAGRMDSDPLEAARHNEGKKGWQDVLAQYVDHRGDYGHQLLQELGHIDGVLQRSPNDPRDEFFFPRPHEANGIDLNATKSVGSGASPDFLTR